MSDTELMNIIIILLELPKDTYFKRKHALLKNVSHESDEIKNFLMLLFALVEKHRPDLSEEKGGVLV